MPLHSNHGQDGRATTSWADAPATRMLKISFTDGLADFPLPDSRDSGSMLFVLADKKRCSF
jgi:hypothetical protein